MLATLISAPLTTRLISLPISGVDLINDSNLSDWTVLRSETFTFSSPALRNPERYSFSLITPEIQALYKFFFAIADIFCFGTTIRFFKTTTTI